MDERLDLGAQRDRRAQDGAEELARRLHRALGPTVLLALVGVDLGRQLGRHHQVGKVEELPAGQLGAVGEVEVFGQGVVRPAAGLVDRLPAPDPGGAVEVEKTAAALARGVLDHKMAVEKDRLSAGQQRIVSVDVTPAGLHHADLGIHEMGHAPAQELGTRNKIGIEDGDQLASRRLETGGQGAGLEARPIVAMQVVDVEAFLALALDQRGDQLDGLVGRVVEHLDLQPVARIVDTAHGLDQPLRDVLFVEDRQLDGDDRPARGIGYIGRLRRAGAQIDPRRSATVRSPAPDGVRRSRPGCPESGNRVSGSTRSTTRSSLAVLLDQVRAERPALLEASRVALPVAAAHLALAATGDPAVRPLLTLLLLIIAFAFFARAALRLERVDSTVAILCVAAVLRVLLLPLPPTLSDDTLRYTWDGRVARAGFNPYLLAPEAPELEPLRDELWQRMPHKDVPTVYPPLALATFGVASALPRPLVSVKILLVLAELVGCWLLIRLARRLGLPAGRAIWYCWNPLVCLEVAGMGHVDALVVTATVATVFVLAGAGGRPRAAVTAAGAAVAGVLSKLVPLVALPMWARHSGRPVVFLTAACGLIALCMMPVVLTVGGVPPGLVTYGVSWEFNGPLYEPLWRALDGVALDEKIKGGLDALKQRDGRHDFWNRFYPYVYPQLLAKLILAVAFFCVIAASLFVRHPVPGSGFLFGGLVLCAATVYPWYLLWVLPWAALARHKAWLALSGLMPLSYLPQLLGLPLFPWFYLLIWVPFFFLLPVSRWTID